MALAACGSFDNLSAGAADDEVAGARGRTRFCDIARQPSAYAQRVVEFPAYFETDGHHWAILTHPDCDGLVMFIRDEDTAVIRISDSPRGDEPERIRGFRLIATAAHGGFSGTFSGIFRPSREHVWSQPEPFGVLSLRRIDNFRSEDRPQPPPPPCDRECKEYERNIMR